MNIAQMIEAVEKWHKGVHPNINLELDIMHSFIRHIDMLTTKIANLERIVEDMQKSEQNNLDSSDSETKNRFFASVANPEPLHSKSEKNGQAQPEESALTPSSHNMCCGNCEHFIDEDAEGIGWCKHPSVNMGTTCDELCKHWNHRGLQQGEAVMWKTCDSQHCWKLGYY